MCFVFNMQINTNIGIQESFILKSPPLRYAKSWVYFDII